MTSDEAAQILGAELTAQIDAQPTQPLTDAQLEILAGILLAAAEVDAAA